MEHKLSDVGFEPSDEKRSVPHILRRESVHPSPDATTLMPRMQQVNWSVVARGKINQALSHIHGQGPDHIIPSYVADAAHVGLQRILPVIDFDHLDHYVSRICEAAVDAYNKTANAVVKADTEQAVEEGVTAAVEEVEDIAAQNALQTT
ncbi:hypothetical protein AUJ46_00085 [Candidatus Peregrinibacteria bacterium CG1_02_54_53]|nr:MAG: hypothetical protein AUJ46_00085 [Candidatus Peregrinibacteria bacterium CG1_02_54_53]